MYMFLITIALFFRSYVHSEKTEECHNVAKMPMSSRGFAKACCTVYPHIFGKHTGGIFEAGSRTDPHYFYNTKIISGDVVYVAAADLPDFINYHFINLPSHSRIVLVSGSEDIGTPFELFHPNRSYGDYTMQALWPRGQMLTMHDFISDERLASWFVQNYDLVGCNHFSCSDVDPAKRMLFDKVQPLPIGLDFHTLSEKVRGVPYTAVSQLVCAQRRDLQSIKDSGFIMFKDRPLLVNFEFDCVFDTLKDREPRMLVRGELCKLLSDARESNILQELYVTPLNNAHRKLSKRSGKSLRGMLLDSKSYLACKYAGNRECIKNMLVEYKKSFKRKQRLDFWKRVSLCSFGFAPAGLGMDTHRLWEILQMHAVPIVLSSPLDELYSHYPIVIVKRWAEAFESGALEKFKRAILDKFGEDPFNDEMMYRLTMEFWVQKIHATAHKIAL